MTSQVVSALHLLVDDFCAQGCYLHAIKCLEALCNVETLPQVGGEAHVKLSELLLEHTNNLREAKIHATRAQITVKGLPGAFQLKCRIAFQLGACHHKLGESNQRKQAYMKGLELCKDSVFVQNESTAHEWFCQFSALLADTFLDEDQSQKALQHLWKGQERAKKQKLRNYEVTSDAFHIQALLLSGDCSAAAENLKEFFLRSIHLPKSELDPNFTKQIALHGLILQVLLALKRGNIIPLVKNSVEVPGAPGTKPKHIPSVVKEMEVLLHKSYGTQPVLSTSPWPILKMTVDLLSAAILRYQGKLDLSMDYVRSGLRCISDQLEKYGMQQDGVGCLEKSCGAGWRVGPFLFFRYLLLESSVQTSLLKCEFKNAQQTLLDVLQFLDAWPSMGASVSVGHYSMALRHFYLVVQANASPSQAVFGRICCALSEIGANTSESVSHALDAIGPGPNNTDNTPMESGERAVHHFASGYIHSCQNNTQEAKANFSSGLKLVHKQVGNHELMCHMLNTLSMIHLDRGDVHGAQQMLDSCYVMAKHSGDIVAILGSLSAMEKLCMGEHMQEKVSGIQACSKLQQGVFQQNVHEAIDSGVHGVIENWDLGR